MFSYQNIIVKTDDKIGRIILDRKQSNNSLDTSISKEIFEAMVALQKLKQIRLITIHGNKKFFSPGADIRELESLDKKSAKEKKLFGYFDKILEIEIPIIACVEGYALGGGMELALISDFIIASKASKFAQPEINLGLIPGIGGTQRLKNYVGKYNANYLCMTGEIISSQRAYELGIVSALIDEDKFEKNSEEIIKKISSKPRSSLVEIKKLISKDEVLHKNLIIERNVFYNLLDSENKKIGIKSFFEKTNPNWID